MISLLDKKIENEQCKKSRGGIMCTDEKLYKINSILTLGGGR